MKHVYRVATFQDGVNAPRPIDGRHGGLCIAKAPCTRCLGRPKGTLYDGLSSSRPTCGCPPFVPPVRQNIYISNAKNRTLLAVVPSTFHWGRALLMCRVGQVLRCRTVHASCLQIPCAGSDASEPFGRSTDVERADTATTNLTFGLLGFLGVTKQKVRAVRVY